MSVQLRAARRLVVVCLWSFAALLKAQNPAPNSDPAYQQLRNVGLGGEAVSVNNLVLKRDAATFHLQSGTVCFLAPVQGKVTGAVFVGQGNMVLEPPLAIERSTLKLLTKQDEFVESYEHLVLRFTDTTYEELKKGGGAASGSCDAGLLRDSQNAMRYNRELRYNLDARILQDVLGSAPGGLFVAFVNGNRYNDKEIYVVDPHGAPPLILRVAPEEVELITYDDNKLGVWASFHLSSEYSSGTASGAQQNGVIRIEHQQLDTTMKGSGELQGKATTTFVAQSDGVRVIPFALFPTLRVESATGDGGQPLAFIQEDKKQDADFSVILPKPLSAGSSYTVTTTYAGKDAVVNTGSGNYFPVAREDWYPNSANLSLGHYASYDMTFRIPKGMKIAATGTLVSESNESGEDVTVWKSEVPQDVAGFNFGRFKMVEAKLKQPDYLVQSYANEGLPDWARNFQQSQDSLLPHGPGEREAPGMALGSMNTTSMMKDALADGELAVQLYTNYFGPLPFKRLAITQQTACNFGQAWPELVWLPICSFYDATVRHALGIDFGDRGYWKIVEPHEVAHQWWGHEVGFNSYRDQWMSEGFAEMSASLYLQLVEKNPKKLISFWNDERDLLLERNAQGFRAIDAGPVTLGYRLDNSRTGVNITRHLIYPKGAYILYMIRMMMWDTSAGDQTFKATMQDFAKTYAGRAATTEDFKAMVEKHMTPEMDLDGNHKMDWFFNEYVYGTELPTYSFQPSFEKSPSGDVVFNLKLSQSNVDPSFRMLVPIYFELANGQVVFFARARMTGSHTIDQKIPLQGLKDTPHRAMIDYYDDVLATN